MAVKYPVLRQACCHGGCDSRIHLRLFLNIENGTTEQIFDKARAGDEYFTKSDDETGSQFRKRVTSTTEANPIIMYPQSYDAEFRANIEHNKTQMKALARNVCNGLGCIRSRHSGFIQ
jgi:hypothetical protein